MTIRRLTPACFLVPAILLSGCHLVFGPDDGQGDWWTYCDRDGCVRCDVNGCDVPDGRCDPNLPFDPCPGDAYCDPGRKVCRGAGCSASSECGEGYVCSSGVCVPRRAPCGSHGECGPGAYCDNGACKPSKTCSKDSDCALLGEFVCDPRGSCVPGVPRVQSCTKAFDCEGAFCLDGQCGSCTGDCGGGRTCELQRHCGAGRACLDGQCVNSCTTDGQCGSGQICRSKICAPRTTAQCTRNVECGAGKVCVNQACHPDCTVTGKCSSAADRCGGPLDVGSLQQKLCVPDHSAKLECKVTSECKNGESCVNGICRTSCLTSKDCAVCDDGPVCGKGGYCMTDAEFKATCTRSSQCAGKACLNGLCVSL